MANGDGAKSIWFTEFGLATGQNYASWPALAKGSGSALTISSGTAQASDVGCLVGAPGLPFGSYVAAMASGESWTVLPPTGLMVNQALTAGATITQLEVAAAQYAIIAPTDGKSAPSYVALPSGAGGAVTIQPGTTLSVWLGNGNGYHAGLTLSTSPEVQVPAIVGTVMIPFTVTVTGTGGQSVPVTVEPGGTVTLDIESVAVSAGGAYPNGYPFPATGGAIQAAESLGQVWPAAVPSTGTDASTGAPVETVVNIVAPGLLAPTRSGRSPTPTSRCWRAAGTTSARCSCTAGATPATTTAPAPTASRATTAPRSPRSPPCRPSATAPGSSRSTRRRPARWRRPAERGRRPVSPALEAPEST